jgi:cysteinyl-tRNA synthetase
MGDVVTVANRKKFIFNADEIVEAIRKLNDNDTGYVASTWSIAFEIKQRNERAEFSTSALREYLKLMEMFHFVESERRNRSDLIWRIPSKK